MSSLVELDNFTSTKDLRMFIRYSTEGGANESQQEVPEGEQSQAVSNNTLCTWTKGRLCHPLEPDQGSDSSLTWSCSYTFTKSFLGSPRDSHSDSLLLKEMCITISQDGFLQRQ